MTGFEVRTPDVVDFHFEHLSNALGSLVYAGFLCTGFVSKEHQPWNGLCPVFCLVNIYKPCRTIVIGGLRNTINMGGERCCFIANNIPVAEHLDTGTKALPMLSA